MTDAKNAATFRKEAERLHLLLKPTNTHDSRFILKLGHGDVVIVRHPRKIRELLDLAKIVHAGSGEYDELLNLAAPRANLQPSSMEVEVVWTGEDGPDRVRLAVWLEDQFLLEKAMRLIGFPQKA